MTHYRIETSQERRISPGWAITIAVLCLAGALGCSLSKVLVEPLVAAAVNSRQEASQNPALATRTPCPTFTPTEGPIMPAPSPSPEATPTQLPAACAVPAVAELPGGADAPGPVLAKAEAPSGAVTPEFALAEADTSELALAEVDADAAETEAPPEADTSELGPTETNTPEAAPSDTATPKPKPKPKPTASAQPPTGTATATATRRPVVMAVAAPPMETATPTIAPTPAPKFTYNAVETYFASTTNAFLTGYIMIVNADDIPIGGVKAVGSFDPGGAHHESTLSKWFFEGYSAPGPVLKTSSVKFEPPGGIQKGTWTIHLESEQGARLSEDVPIMTDPATPEWFFIEFKQPGPRSTPTPTPAYDWEATQTAVAATATATPKPGTPTVVPTIRYTPAPTSTPSSGGWVWPY